MFFVLIIRGLWRLILSHVAMVAILEPITQTLTPAIHWDGIVGHNRRSHEPQRGGIIQLEYG